MDQKPLNLAIVGCGNIAEAYTFFAWLELDNPPALALMLHVHLDLLLQGMKST